MSQYGVGHKRGILLVDRFGNTINIPFVGKEQFEELRAIITDALEQAGEALQKEIAEEYLRENG